MLDTLLNTLIRQIKLQPEQARIVAKRFVRSVIRVFVVFNIELAPGQSKKRSSSLHHRNIDQGSMAQYLQKCKRVFQGTYIICFYYEEKKIVFWIVLEPIQY